MSPDLQADLMRKIRDRWGTAITAAVLGATADISTAFLAALIANESGGDPGASRFEPSALGSLVLVLIGKKAEYAPAGIMKPLTAEAISEALPPVDVLDPTFDSLLRQLVNFSTSWGLTQIMGWHAIEFNQPLEKITAPESHLVFAAMLLAYFSSRYKLTSGENEKLFRCWNTGRPDGKTFDPEYVPRGMARIAAYISL